MGLPSWAPLAVLYLLALSFAVKLPTGNVQLFHGSEGDILNLEDIRTKSGFPRDCDSIPKNSSSGVYVIQPAGSPPLVVWCNMDTKGQVWTVVQRNSYNTELEWNDSWANYKYGFGDVQNDYWLGNEYISLLTIQGAYKVRFVVQDASNNTHYAEYDTFSVDTESRGYALRLGRYTGAGKDLFTKEDVVHDNMKFSTYDNDQDLSSTANCAEIYQGGWWHSKCYYVKLNGKGKNVRWSGVCSAENCRSTLILVKRVC
ncbi:fibrinogen-like protein 1-like protein [Chrysemys picta bellii]|uniref:fibrinogen-like protein 1-like protein n=1 Tax=Chrysemys picta bellii TaxID=8478 RepID=UPI001C666FC0|nr:fibrinogen-like protein 1-like protein isoform X1 [Chrysemys picta bellii]